MNEIAVVKQLPKITYKIKEIGESLEERLDNLELDNLICNEETRKEIADLRAALKKEQAEYEKQRKNIKNEILKPYEDFNKIYTENIKVKYDEAITILTSKISVVENEIKENTKSKMIDFFEECRQANSINPEWLNFEELNISIGINQLTPKGDLVKKVKDIIKDSIKTFTTCIETIKTMQFSDEILVEYLKTKNLSIAIKEVNDRHSILEQVQRDYEVVQEIQQAEEQVVEKVEDVLQAPVEEINEGQMSIDDFEEPNQLNEELLETKFKVITTRENLRYLVKVMKERGMKYESITD